MVMQKTRRHRARSGSGILSKDPYGLFWLALIYLAILFVKWWIISPAKPEDTGCMACAMGVIWLLSVSLYSVLIFFWIGWTRSNAKGPVFVFFLAMLCLILTIVDYYVVKIVMSKLLYAGVFHWEESEAYNLIDILIPHSVALMALVSISYSMVRTLLCRDLVQKPLVYTFVGIVLLSSIPLYLMGIKLY